MNKPSLIYSLTITENSVRIRLLATNIRKNKNLVLDGVSLNLDNVDIRITETTSEKCLITSEQSINLYIPVWEDTFLTNSSAVIFYDKDYQTEIEKIKKKVKKLHEFVENNSLFVVDKELWFSEQYQQESHITNTVLYTKNVVYLNFNEEMELTDVIARKKASID
jgi:hypothetical protein